MSTTDMITLSQWAEDWGKSISAARYRCAQGHVSGAKKVGKTWYVPEGTCWPNSSVVDEIDDMTTIGDYTSRFKPISREILYKDKYYAHSVLMLSGDDEYYQEGFEKGVAWLDAHLVSHVISMPVLIDLTSLFKAGEAGVATLKSSHIELDNYVFCRGQDSREVFDHMRLYYSERLKRFYIVAHSYASEETIRAELTDMSKRVPIYSEVINDSWYFPGNATMVVVTAPMTFLDWVLINRDYDVVDVSSSDKGEESSVTHTPLAYDMLQDDSCPSSFKYFTYRTYFSMIGDAVQTYGDELRKLYEAYVDSQTHCGWFNSKDDLDSMDACLGKVDWDDTILTPYNCKGNGKSLPFDYSSSSKILATNDGISISSVRSPLMDSDEDGKYKTRLQQLVKLERLHTSDLEYGSFTKMAAVPGFEYNLGSAAGYVALVLNCNKSNISGLSNEYGAIPNDVFFLSVSSGLISYILTSRLAAYGKIIFVPNRSTLDTLWQLVEFCDASYGLMFVGDDTIVSLTDEDIDFTDIMSAVSKDDFNISSFVEEYKSKKTVQ